MRSTAIEADPQFLSCCCAGKSRKLLLLSASGFGGTPWGLPSLSSLATSVDTTNSVTNTQTLSQVTDLPLRTVFGH